MKQCSIKNCGEKNLARQLCGTHYAQLRKGKLVGQMVPFKPAFERRKNQGKTCKVNGCGRNAERALFCMAHYQRVQVHGHAVEEKPVTVRKGWHYHKTGYIVIPAKGHPNANAAGSIMEHIKVMSDHLGRPLKPGENVHHKNGVRDDNRLENLELWVKHQPCGARVHDLIIFAKEILNNYGNDETKY